MDVQVRNVPRQTTAKVLDDFLKPHLKVLAIKSVHWARPKDKTYAFLTFLHASEGEKFLLQHGQVRSKDNKPSRIRVLLKFANQPLYFERSTNSPDPLVLRGLAKEDKDRQLVVRGPDGHARTAKNTIKFEPVTFMTTNLSCGTWTYIQGELVFVPQEMWEVKGFAKFGQRSMILTLDSGKRIDFRYNSILEVVAQDSPGSLIMSMAEPPRFFEQINKPLEDLMQQLRLPGQNPQQNNRRSGPDRHRLPCLDERHESLAGHCLVYRMAMPYLVNGGNYGDRFHNLVRNPQLPPVSRHYVRVRYPTVYYSTEFLTLEAELSNLMLGFPFVVAFQVQRLAQNNYLPPATVMALIPEIENIFERSGENVCVSAVRNLFGQIDYPSLEVDASDFEKDSLLSLLKENEKVCVREKSIRELVLDENSEYEQPTPLLKPNTETTSENVVLIHKVKVTPSGLLLNGPELETNNRVLRKFPKHHDYFLRVVFCDEDSTPVRQSFKVSHDRIFYGRFKRVLDEGITIVGRHYDFLGFSHSSLRMQTCWFMAPFVYEETLMYARIVVRDLGDFSNIFSPAKCAARIGQAFSDTPTTISVKNHQVIDDVQRGERVFSDGVGTISKSIMEKICEKLKRKHISKPTCFQIRYQGAKGMLALDSRLKGDVINLRPSMIKFEGSTSPYLEICESAYRPLPLYLNRQLIKILEDMGVDENWFLDLQAKEVARLRMITENAFNASSFLKRQSIGEVILLPYLITELELMNIDFKQDGFLRDVVEVALLFELRQLKHKTRIPVEKGWHLHGIMDETGYLEEGEVFVTVTIDGKTQVILGEKLVISRSPALHPGDVQLANGVLPPPGSPLLDLQNCVVFSQKGVRDLASQLSGGDLDGDRFCIIYDEGAQPSVTFSPADYSRPTPLDIGRPVQTSDMTEHFIKFMESDQLGQIAVSHRVLADVKPEGTLHPDCQLLAEMHSTAVDFSKTGIPVDMSKFPRRPKFRPDFEAPGPTVLVEKLNGTTLAETAEVDPQDQEDEDDDLPRYRYYESQKVLGKLYRAIDERQIFADIQHREAGVTSQSTVIDAVWESVKLECKLIQWEHLREWAENVREMYENGLRNVMINFSDNPLRPLSELEAFVGNILGKTGAQNRVQHDTSVKMKERVDENNRFIVNCILKEGADHSTEALERSIACLAVSLDQNTVKAKDQLLSFKYVAAAICLKQVEKLYGNLPEWNFGE